jgi:hypothetical protein
MSGHTHPGGDVREHWKNRVRKVKKGKDKIRKILDKRPNVCYLIRESWIKR